MMYHGVQCDSCGKRRETRSINALPFGWLHEVGSNIHKCETCAPAPKRVRYAVKVPR